MYIGREYESMLPTRWRYRRNRILIPTPQFIAFYNGKNPYPAENELRLSDAFRCHEADEFVGTQLEVRVKVINSNFAVGKPQ